MAERDKDDQSADSGRPGADELALFREAIGEVRRIHADPLPDRPRPAAEPRQRLADDREVLASLGDFAAAVEGAEGGDVLSYLAPGYRRRWLRRLIRGQFVVADQIDLHHLDQVRASKLLGEFLRQSRAHDRLCVRVIHGKGGARGSVLKAMVERELLRRIEVIAFHSAAPNQGGTGAVDVLLRGQR